MLFRHSPFPLEDQPCTHMHQVMLSHWGDLLRTKPYLLYPSLLSESTMTRQAQLKLVEQRQVYHTVSWETAHITQLAQQSEQKLGHQIPPPWQFNVQIQTDNKEKGNVFEETGVLSRFSYCVDLTWESPLNSVFPTCEGRLTKLLPSWTQFWENSRPARGYAK